MRGRQQDRELVAAQARGTGRAPAGWLLQDPRDVDDQLVAPAVPEGVVDLLEVVDVEHQRRPLLAVASDVGDVAVEFASKRRRFSSPVSGSWSARCWRSRSSRLWELTSSIWPTKYRGSPSAVAHERGVGRDLQRVAARVDDPILGRVPIPLAVGRSERAQVVLAERVVGVGEPARSATPISSSRP